MSSVDRPLHRMVQRTGSSSMLSGFRMIADLFHVKSAIMPAVELLSGCHVSLEFDGINIIG